MDDIQLEPSKKYAFIDVSNTAGTARKLLGIEIDWAKLYQHLTDPERRWVCENVYYYEGRKDGTLAENRHSEIEKLGYKVRSKIKKNQKDKEKTYVHACSNCGEQCELTVKIPGPQKSNCDVELTVDATELAGPNTEFLLFTGDGDFHYLIENVIEKGTKVRVVSNTGRDTDGNKRFSTRLQELLDREEKTGARRVTFIDLNDWKISIKA